MTTPTARRWPTVRLAVATCAAATLFLAACGGDDDTSSGEATSSSGIEVEGAWARTTAEGQPAGAAYMTVTAEADDAIVGASVPEDVAGVVELHETVPADDAGDEGMDMGEEGSTTTAAEDDAMDEGDMGTEDGGDDEMDMGAMTMVPVETIDLPAGEAVSLEPGGLHIMLLELAGPLEAGDTFDVTLSLESGEELVVPIEVSDQAP